MTPDKEQTMGGDDSRDPPTEDRMTDTLYKALDADGKSPYQGHEWPLPNGRPGKWVGPVEGELVECKNGLHCCTADQLICWLDERLYVIEPRERTEEKGRVLCMRCGRNLGRP